MNTSLPKGQMTMYTYLIDQMSLGRFAVHGSAFHVKGKTILLIGRSGVGKTTLRSYFTNTYQGTVIQDDKPFLVLKDGKLCVQGHAYTSDNESRYDENMYPIDQIYVLKKAEQLNIEPLHIDPLTLWIQFGIGIPENTHVLGQVLKQLGNLKVYQVDVLHKHEIFLLLDQHIFS
jgi:GTPase SAR1 family protein